MNLPSEKLVSSLCAFKFNLYRYNKNQIKSMTKRINSDVWKKFKNVDVSK